MNKNTVRKIFLAAPRGFCAGVCRALETVEASLRKYPNRPVRVFHEIVHNEHVVRHFEQQGVKFVNSLLDIEPDAVLIFSAHGVEPRFVQMAAEKNIHTIDATCPLVKKIHAKAGELSKAGYQIFLIGHRDHAEIIATLGHCPADTRVVESISDVEKLPRPKERCACLTQTTLNIFEGRKIYEAIRARFPQCENYSGICYATANRQEAVKNLCSYVDKVFIVGSQKSSNSRRLRECAENCAVEAILIDDAHAIKAHMLENCENIGLSAGASAPEELVSQSIEKIKKLSGCEVETVEIAGTSENTVFKLPDI